MITKRALFVLPLIILLMLTACATKNTTEVSKANDSKPGALADSEKAETKEEVEVENETGENLDDPMSGTDLTNIPSSYVKSVGEEMRVNKVIDGITLELITTGNNSKTETVRLLSLEVPKVDESGDYKTNSHAKHSIEAASEMLENRMVYFERPPKDQPQKDDQGRSLGYLWFLFNPGYTNYNWLFTLYGNARVIEAPGSDEKYMESFKAAQENAKSERKNIWYEDGYVTDSGFNPDVLR